MGEKICIKLDDAREFILTEVNGKKESFKIIKGHIMCKTKDNMTLEMLFARSNKGD